MAGNAIPIQTKWTRAGEMASAVSDTFDFAVSARIVRQIDLAVQGTSCVQAMMIDNSANADTVTFAIQGTQQLVVVPPFSQAFFRILQIGQSFALVATSGGAVTVKVSYLNFPMETQVWSVTSPGTPTGTITIAGSVTTTPVGGAATDRSIGIVTGGTARQVMAANGSRKGMIVFNPATGAGQNIADPPESAYFRFGATAGIDDGTSFEVTPGGYLLIPTGVVPTGLLSFNAATTGHRIIANEF